MTATLGYETLIVPLELTNIITRVQNTVIRGRLFIRMQFVEGVKNELLLSNSESTIHDLSILVSEELASRLESSMVSMLPSGTVPEDFIILSTPHSEEYIIAIDFGGTSVKCAIILRGGFHVVCSDQYKITSHVVDSSFFNDIIEWVCERVFDYIGEKESEFLVGTTFSFPLNSNNEITTMGKGFHMTEGIKNVSILEILEQSFEHVLCNNPNYRFKVSVCGVINDSIAVFLTNQALHGNNDTAMILGTGVNFCFPLPYDRVPKSKLPLAYPEGARVLINSEAGFLGAGYLPLKKFYPHHKGNLVPFMPLEYLTSGKWIPFTLRNALAYCGMFPHPSSMKFTGEVVCGILERQPKYTALFGDDFEDVMDITKLLIDRAAFCLFAAISGIYRFQYGRDLDEPIVIGYAGSFLHRCTYYYEKLKEVSAGKVTYNFLPDSNLVGAAIHAVYYSGRY